MPILLRRIAWLSFILTIFTVGGCGDYSDEQWAQYRALEAREAARNAGTAITFDSETTAIVTDNSDFRLLSDFAVDKLYGRGTVDNRPVYLLSRLGALSHCDDDGMRPMIERIGGRATRVFGPPLQPRTDNIVACAVTLPGRPDGPILRVAHLEETTEIDDLDVTRVTVFVTDPDGNRYRLHALRPSLGNEDYRSMPARVLARALAIPPRATPSATLAQAVDADIARADGAMLATDRAALEQLLATPTATQFPQDRFPAIASSPERSAPYAERAIAALRQTVEADGPDGVGRVGGEALVQFVAALPQSSILAQGPQLLAVFDRPERPYWLVNHDLTRRLGELGPTALPVVNSLVEADDYTHSGSLAALCQIGSPATPAMRTLLLDRWQVANEPTTYTRRVRRHRHRWYNRDRQRTYARPARFGREGGLFYITLIRVGLRADADRLARHAAAKEWPRETAAINARTSPTICTSDLPRLSY